MVDSSMGPVGTPGARPTVLLVDSDDSARDALSRALRGSGFVVKTAATAAAGLVAARESAPDFAVVEAGTPHTKGQPLMEALAPISPRTKIVVMNRYGSIAAAVEAMHRGAHHYLTKPVDPTELVATLCSSAPPARREPSTPSLARAVWEHMLRVLVECDGNISAAARRLGIPRRTLQLKLKKYPPRH